MATSAVWQMYVAGLSPVSPTSVFEVANMQSAAGAQVAVAAVSNRAYRIEFNDGALTNRPQAWSPFAANGTWTNLSPYTNRHVFVDTGAATNSGSTVHTQRAYRIWVNLPQ